MLTFAGDKEFVKTPAELWPYLSDARFLVTCIPDVVSVSQSETDMAACTLRPGFSFVRGTLEVNLRIVEAIAPSSLRFSLRGKSIGSSSTLETRLTLAPRGGETRVDWSVSITELGGLLKAVPQGLIKAAAQKVIGDVWHAIEAKLKA